MPQRIEKAYDDSSLGRYVWFIRPFIYNAFLTPLAGDLLSWLIDTYRFRKRSKFVDRYGFFKLSRDEVREDFYVNSKNPLQRQVRELQELGILEVKMMGNPAKRHVRIHFKKVDELCEKHTKSKEIRGCQTSTPGPVDKRQRLLKNHTNNHTVKTSKDVFPRAPKRGSLGLTDDSLEAHDELAFKFHEFLERDNNLPIGTKKTTWGKYFRLLIRDHGEKQIRQVLDWYIANYGKKGVPIIKLASSFRKKFKYVLAAKERHEGKQIAISDEVKKLVSYLDDLKWTKVSKEDVLQTFQISFDNARHFMVPIRLMRKDLEGKKKKTQEEQRAFSILNRLEEIREDHVVSEYLRDLNRRIETWDGWSGRLTTMALKVQEFERRLIAEYEVNVNRWKWIVPRLEKYRESRSAKRSTGKNNSHRNDNKRSRA